MRTDNERISLRKRQRYAEDPEFREKCCARSRTFRRENREKINEEMRQKRASDPEFCEKDRARPLNRRRKRVYGITTEDYNRMLARQHGACAICKQRYGQKLCIDHCHATRKVRGLLCHRCNVGLGCYADDPSRLREAAAYLEAARDLPPSSISHRDRLAASLGDGSGETVGVTPSQGSAPRQHRHDRVPEGSGGNAGAPQFPRCPLSPAPGTRDTGQANRATTGAVPLSPALARDAGQAIASHSGPDLNGAASLPPAQSASPVTRRHPEAHFFGDVAHWPSGHPIGSISCLAPPRAPPPAPGNPLPVNSPCCVWSAASATGRDHHSPSG
jgi:hypothetical protein